MNYWKDEKFLSQIQGGRFLPLGVGQLVLLFEWGYLVSKVSCKHSSSSSSGHNILQGT